MGGEDLVEGNRRMQQGEAFLSFLLYVGGLLLALEWLSPLHDLTDSEPFSLFVIYAILCFGLTYLQLSSLLSFFIKMMGLLFIIDRAFLPRPAFGSEWFQQIQWEGRVNINALFNQNWHQLTDLFQTFLLLILIALMSYLLYFWLITMKRVFVYIVLTIVFITVMDTFTTFQADLAIIRLLMVSLFMLVIGNYLKRVKQQGLTFEVGLWFEKVVVPLFVIVAIAVFVGYYAPKSEPVWPDPVPFLTTTAERLTTNDQNRQVGYSEDDAQLGGSFEQDDTPVFRANTPVEHYWRIESLDTYTGHSWERSTELSYQSFQDDALDLIYNQQDQMLQNATIDYLDGANFDRLVYPQGLSQVNQTEALSLQFDHETGIIEPTNANDSLHSEPIELSFRDPDLTVDQLRRANGPTPADITSLYLQLPDDLPDRVRELAEEIVSEESTRYDQAVAIEQYFNQGDFTYQTQNIPVPEDDQDYVDQFLFETQAGYCDNFSTSMVVMLRSVGIPARWVKGFTSGEQIEDLSTADQEMYQYEVTNGNAHSWVEVYFLEIGWVPFEPTIGFSGNEVVYEDSEEEGDQSDSSLDEEEIEQEDQEEEESLAEEQEQEQQEEQEETAAETEQATSQFNIWPWFIGLVGLSLIIAAIRWKWLLKKAILWRWSHFKEPKDLQKAYHQLLKLLALFRVKRAANQTLHDFAQDVDQLFGITSMSKLTNSYARLLYRDDHSLDDDQALVQYYQNVVETILS